jgi:hypothetical protein
MLRVGHVEEVYPEFAPLLRTAADFRIHPPQDVVTRAHEKAPTPIARAEAVFVSCYEARRMPRLSRSSRSDSDSPPQMPYGSPTANACARHCATTGH